MTIERTTSDCTSQKKIARLVKKIAKIHFNFYVKKDIHVIVDFYNVYCNLIKFNKYKTFSEESWLLTIKCIINSIPKGARCVLVSKPIFEISEQNINSVISTFNNLSYMIVEDLFPVKENNRERDDYVCILLHYVFCHNKEKSLIVTNDKYSNYQSILANIKKFNLVIYTKTQSCSSIIFDDTYIQSVNKDLKNFTPDKTYFYFGKQNERIKYVV